VDVVWPSQVVRFEVRNVEELFVESVQEIKILSSEELPVLWRLARKRDALEA
jgi:hypothetical protein